MNKTWHAFCIPLVSANFCISARVFSSFLGQVETHKARDLILWRTRSMLHGSKKNTYLGKKNRLITSVLVNNYTEQNQVGLDDSYESVRTWATLCFYKFLFKLKNSAKTNLQSTQKHRKFGIIIIMWVKQIQVLTRTTNRRLFIYFWITEKGFSTLPDSNPFKWCCS